MYGGSADTAALQNRNRTVVCRAHAAVLEQQGQHVVLALVEILACVVAALLEHHDVASGRRELRGHDRAACARPDHAHLRRLALGAGTRSSLGDHAGLRIQGPRYPMRGQVSSWLQ